MPTVLEGVGKKTNEHLDYVGSLNIQLWSTLRAMKSALPLIGSRYRWQATVRQILQIGYDAPSDGFSDGTLHGIHSCLARSLGVATLRGSAVRD